MQIIGRCSDTGWEELCPIAGLYIVAATQLNNSFAGALLIVAWQHSGTSKSQPLRQQA